MPPAALKLTLDRAEGSGLRAREPGAEPAHEPSAPSPQPRRSGKYANAAPSWWAARAREGEVKPGFTKAEILRPAKEDPRAPGGVFERVGGAVERPARSKVKCCDCKVFMKLKTRCSAVVLRPRGRSRPRAAEIIEQILVKVNGEIFTKTDLEQRQVAALRQKGQAIDLKSDPEQRRSSARRSTRSRRSSWSRRSTRCSSCSAARSSATS